MSNLINLSNTTPVAPANGQNVLWQVDGSSPNNVSAYLALGSVTTNVLINLAGVVYGDANFTYNPATQVVASTGILKVTSNGSGPTNRTNTMLELIGTSGGVAYLSVGPTGGFAINNSAHLIEDLGSLSWTSAGTTVLQSGANGASLSMNVAAGALPAGSVSWFMPNSGVGTAIFSIAGQWQWDTGISFMKLFGTSSGSVSIGTAAAAGSSNPLLLPVLSGLAGQGLITDGNNPQQTSWSYTIPSIAKINSTSLTANVGATLLFAVPASGDGIYRVSAYVVETTAGSITSTLPNVQIVFTDIDTGGVITIDATPILGIAGIGQTGALTANTIGTASAGVIVIAAKASTNINYQTVNYASNAAGMAYSLRIRLEAI